MEELPWQDEVAKRVWLLQLIVGCLLGGVLLFLGIVIVLVQFRMVPQPDIGPVLQLVLLVYVVGAIAARVIVPRMIVARARRQIREGTWQLPQGYREQSAIQEYLLRTGDAGKLSLVWFARTIVAAALIEGVAFFANIVYLLAPSLVNLGAALVLTAGLALHIPSRSGTVQWVEEQLRLIEEERLLERPDSASTL